MNGHLRRQEVLSLFSMAPVVSLKELVGQDFVFAFDENEQD